MKQSIKSATTTLVLGATLGVSTSSWATNGFFGIGVGSKSRGMAGVAIALPQDATAASANPAGIAFVGNRTDAGMELFNPNRNATLDATGMGGAVSADRSGATLFAVPHAGIVKQDDDLSYSFVAYANGGLNTRYGTNIFAQAFGPAAANFTAPNPPPSFPNTGTLGVNLAQLILAPSVAYKINEDHAVGASLLVGYQTFRAYGMGLFTAFSSDAANVTNNGNDDAWGAGVRLGWTGHLTDGVTVGATAASKIYMQEFDQYAGLFSEQGDFDIPANYGIGIAFQASPRVMVGFDVVRILYSEVKTTGNKGPTGQEFVDSLGAALSVGPSGIPRALGNDNGFGFGWGDQTVYKLGVAYEYNDRWTWRAGFNYGKSPIEEDQNLFNIISLAVVEKHLTAGFTYTPNDTNEITVAAMWVPEEKQSFVYQADLGGGVQDVYRADIAMDQYALEFSYAWKF